MRTVIETLEDYLDIGKFRRGKFLVGPWCNLKGPHCCPLIAKMKVCRNRVLILWRNSPLLQSIEIAWQRMHLGGYRPWFVCSGCNRRAGKLYLAEPDFYGPASYKCRTCLGLRYATQQMSHQQKRAFAASKLRLKLNGDARLTEPFPKKPHGMTRRRYETLKYKAQAREARIPRRVKRKPPDYHNLMPYP